MIIDGDLAVDDRGKITFVNDFDFKNVKRFYMVENHQKGFVRAWHGHKNEGKYVFVVSGAVIVACVSIEAPWQSERIVLSADKPRILYIPPGYYNGFKTLTDDAKIIFFSTASLEESKNDDIREPVYRWSGVWEIEKR